MKDWSIWPGSRDEYRKSLPDAPSTSDSSTGRGKNSKEKNVVGEQKANTNEDQTWNFKQENVVA